MSKTKSLCAATLLLIACTSTEAQITGATLHKSQWVATTSRMQCTLLHKIPSYGQALFTQNAGEELTFNLKPKTQFPAAQTIQLVSTAPNWKHGIKSKILLNISVTKGDSKLKIKGKQSLQLFKELTQGMAPRFNTIDAESGQTINLATLSPVQMEPALTEFTTCITNLLPYSYQQIRQSQLHFDFGSSTLLPEMIERADQLVEFIQIDKGIRRVKIDGHTDNVGRNRYNRGLGQKRAEAFKAYLIAKGITEEMIVLKSYGERKPKTSNQTPTGRATNRRILVTLER